MKYRGDLRLGFCVVCALDCGGRSALDVLGGPVSNGGSPTDSEAEAPTQPTDAAEPPSESSCEPGGAGLTNCGPGGSGSDSCCTSLEVNGGTYFRTYFPVNDVNGGMDMFGEADPATVSNFRLDKYLVTVGRFRQFVNAWNGGWLPAAGSGKHTHLNGGDGLNATGGGFESGWMTLDNSSIAPTDSNLTSSCSVYGTWTASAGSQENLPISCVTWQEAYAFCIWDGGFLPSEAEWEYAAAGGAQQREYPWGSTDPGTANQYAIYNCDYPNSLGPCTTTSLANIAPVGTGAMGAGLWGQLDLTGNVWEWSLDWYAAYINPCKDCADLTPAASGRVVRGGDYGGTTPPDLYPTIRESIPPQPYRDGAIGFRCARTP